MKKLLYLSLILPFAVNAQWTSQATGFSAASTGVESINIIDANTVWALGYDGSSSTPANFQLFTRTTNGGTSWTSGAVTIGNAALELTNLSAVNATTAWVGAVSATNGMGGVWKTADGGSTWTQQNATAYTNASSFFNVVHFYDDMNGITQGDPITTTDFEVYKTVNGGAVWTPVPASAMPNIVSGEWGYNGGNVAAGNSFWFVTNKGNIYKTPDMGVTWNKYSTPISDFSGTNVGGSLYFSDNNNGVLLARTGAVATATYKLYKTTNGGMTWDAGTNYTSIYRTFSFIPGTSTLVGNGTDGTTYSSAVSYDMGTTWTQLDSGTQRTGVKFLNTTTGWSGGFTTSATADGIFKYTGPALGSSSFEAIGINIYPNPVNDIFVIESANNSSITALTISDVNGRTVKTINGISISNQISISELNKGIYFLNITSDKGTATKKIIKN